MFLARDGWKMILHNEKGLNRYNFTEFLSKKKQVALCLVCLHHANEILHVSKKRCMRDCIEVVTDWLDGKDNEIRLNNVYRSCENARAFSIYRTVNFRRMSEEEIRENRINFLAFETCRYTFENILLPYSETLNCIHTLLQASEMANKGYNWSYYLNYANLLCSLTDFSEKLSIRRPDLPILFDYLMEKDENLLIQTSTGIKLNLPEGFNLEAKDNMDLVKNLPYWAYFYIKSLYDYNFQ